MHLLDQTSFLPPKVAKVAISSSLGALVGLGRV